MDKETIDLYTDKIVMNIVEKLQSDTTIKEAYSDIASGHLRINNRVEKIIRGEIKDSGEKLYSRDICETLSKGDVFYSGDREIHSYVKRTITQLFIKKMFSASESSIEEIIKNT